MDLDIISTGMKSLRTGRNKSVKRVLIWSEEENFTPTPHNPDQVFHPKICDEEKTSELVQTENNKSLLLCLASLVSGAPGEKAVSEQGLYDLHLFRGLNPRNI